MQLVGFITPLALLSPSKTQLVLYLSRLNHKWCSSNPIQFPKDFCRKMEFTSSLAFPGKRLINHLIRTVESPVQDFCSALCYMEPNCVSYKELVASGSPVITKCELNNSTHNEHPQDLKSWTNYIYKGTMVSTFLSVDIHHSYLCFLFILGLVIFE